MPQENLLKQKKFIYYGVCILMIAIIIGSIFGLRFESPRLNYLFFGIALLCPWFIDFQVILNKHDVIANTFGWTLRTLSIPLFAIWLFIVVIGLPDVITRDVDYSFEPVQSIEIEGKHYQVYRTNGGATTSFGIVVREQTKLLPGLFYEKEVYAEYPATRIVDYEIKNNKIYFISDFAPH
jgi:hypothetical protein